MQMADGLLHFLLHGNSHKKFGQFITVESNSAIVMCQSRHKLYIHTTSILAISQMAFFNLTALNNLQQKRSFLYLFTPQDVKNSFDNIVKSKEKKGEEH